MKKVLFTILMVLAGLVVGSPSASADTGNLWGQPTSIGGVNVQHSISSWNSNTVDTAVGFIDSYTGSADRVHKCSSADRCITIRFGSVPGSALGHTVCRKGNCVITVERGTPVRYRTLLLVHELGHAFGLGHVSKCVSIMYPYRDCWVHLNGQPFTAPEIRALRRV